jgi:translation initiation factor IF-3
MLNDFFIPSPTVTLLDENGRSMGVMPAGKAKDIANRKNIRLTPVNEKSFPPVYSLGSAKKDGILSEQVRLLNANREMIGIMSASEARAKAKEAELDIIVLNANATPNVCMLGDIKKYEYEKKKAAAEKEKKQRQAANSSKLKELKLPADKSDSSKSDRLRLFGQAAKFVSEGHPVRLSVRFRGREMAHSGDVMAFLHDEAVEIVKGATVGAPVGMGNTFTMLCSPVSKK